ncbi:DUF4830 domain-containing protein [Vermiculatibacterium agrestimuris]|uniref:DUF4830 domain-containing protein n=1 Tax=Vermiculatibacterium agrestimuris TaxID=2941519 RepID=UPI0020415D19|nr:DUF4830 domain-containing protein [Vermiculatibacterium agrestimuris]
MLIWTAKVNRRKIGLALMGAVILGAAAVAATVFWGGDAQASASMSPKGVKTAEDRAAYLESWGWQVEPEAVSVEELEMPETFGEEYSQYLELQAAQGFDLTKYAGKRIKRYTLNVLNYPGGTEGVQAHLLLCKNTVIGGEILGEGFLHGLSMPDGQQKEAPC